MNNPNPFLSPGSFLEQKNKARTRLKIAVFFSISLSVVVLMALLIQGCRKPNDTGDQASNDATNTPQLPTPPPETNPAPTPPPETNLPTPPPVAQTPPPAPPPVVAPAGEDYTVIKGDTYSTIAKKNGTTVKALEDANSGVDPKKLKIGEKLHLPASSSTTPGAAPMAAPGTESAGGEQTYKVKSGDSLTSIGKHFHVSIKSIESANNLSTTSIKVGQTLKIPASSSAPAPAAAPVPPPVESTPPSPAPMSTSGPAPLPTAPPPAH